MHTYTAENSIFDSPVTNLLSVIRILIEIISRAHAKGGESLRGFKFGTFVGRFLSDGAASMAVEGLRECLKPLSFGGWARGGQKQGEWQLTSLGFLFCFLFFTFTSFLSLV